MGVSDSIKSAGYSPQIAAWGPIREAQDFRARHPDGRMGSDPAQATPEKGRALVMMAAKGLVQELDASAGSRPPAAIAEAHVEGGRHRE